MGREADQSRPSSAKAKKGAAIPPLLHMSSRLGALIKHRDNFTLPLKNLVKNRITRRSRNLFRGYGDAPRGHM
jgi:hypothetical protein